MVKSDTLAGVTAKEVLEGMEGHIIETAELLGKY